MITPQELIRLLGIENNLIHEQTAGLSQADALLQPQPTGNCMNWVLGHMLDSQITLLQVLGGASPLDGAELQRYKTDSVPITGEGPGVLSLERLLAGHDQVFAAITTRLGEMEESAFVEEIPHRDRLVARGWRVFFLHFHYTYHLGQLELLRQLAGHGDKIV